MVQQTDFYTLRHGEFDVHLLSDGPILLDGRTLVPEATHIQRADVVAILKGADNAAHAQSNIPLIATKDENIDIGVGEMTRGRTNVMFSAEKKGAGRLC